MDFDFLQNIYNASIGILIIRNLREIMNNNFEIQRLIFIYINIYNIIDLFIGLKITKLYIKQKEYIIHHILSLAIITYILNTTDKHLINVSKYILFGDITTYFNSYRYIFKSINKWFQTTTNFDLHNFFETKGALYLSIFSLLFGYSKFFLGGLIICILHYLFNLEDLVFWLVFIVKIIFQLVCYIKLFDIWFSIIFIGFRTFVLHKLYVEYLQLYYTTPMIIIYSGFIILHLFWYYSIFRMIFRTKNKILAIFISLIVIYVSYCIIEILNKSLNIEALMIN